MLIGKRIDIVGAGIAGLSQAIALAQRGASVQVFEQAPEISEVGAGLQISANGFAVLKALGLADQVRSIGVPIPSVGLFDYQQGARILSLNFQKYARDLEFHAVHRADLIALLLQTAQDADVAIHTNTPVQAGGSDNRDASLTIGADGLNSSFRAALNGDGAPFFTGQVAWRALVPTADSAPDTSVRVFLGPGRHVVIYSLRGGTLLNVVAVEERSEWADENWSGSGDPAGLRAAFSGFCPQVQDVLQKVQFANLWGLFRHPVAQEWHDASSVIVGDAAHPTLPFLAQGASLALEDSWVLSDCLATLPQDQALAAYQQRRQNHVARVINAANANARNYHLRNPILRGAAHTLLRASGALLPGRVVRQFDWIYRNDVTSS